MAKTRKKFDKEFKAEAVRMVIEGGMSKAEVGRRLGVNQTLVGTWVKAVEADGNDAFPGKGKLKPMEEEIRRLQQEVKELQMERDFLKKSAAYFASLRK
jgi:transposase